MLSFLLWGVSALASASGITDLSADRSEEEIHRSICELMWYRSPDCKDDEPNPFEVDGLADKLSQEIELDGATARVYAASFRELQVTGSYHFDDGSRVFDDFTCRYPTGWKVDLVRADVQFDSMLAHFDGDVEVGCTARNGVLITAKVFGNRNVNASVYWTLVPSVATTQDYLTIREKLALPKSHTLTAGKELSDAPTNRGAAIAFSGTGDAYQASSWSVYPHKPHVSPIPTEPGFRFLPDRPYPGVKSVRDMVHLHSATDLQRHISWNARQSRPFCSTLPFSERFDCSWDLPVEISELFSTAAGQTSDLFGHVVWYLNSATLALTSVKVDLAIGTLTPVHTSILQGPEELGLPPLSSMGRLPWP